MDSNQCMMVMLVMLVVIMMTFARIDFNIIIGVCCVLGRRHTAFMIYTRLKTAQRDPAINIYLFIQLRQVYPPNYYLPPGLVPKPSSKVAKAGEGGTQRTPVQPLRTPGSTRHGSWRSWWASCTLPWWTFLLAWLHGGHYEEAFRGSRLSTQPDPDADLNRDAPPVAPRARPTPTSLLRSPRARSDDATRSPAAASTPTLAPASPALPPPQPLSGRPRLSWCLTLPPPLPPLHGLLPLSARLSLRLPAGPSRPARGLRLLVTRGLQQLILTSVQPWRGGQSPPRLSRRTENQGSRVRAEARAREGAH